MRDVLGLILFFALVGLVKLLFINAVWKAARKGLPELPDVQQENAQTAPAEHAPLPARRRLPALLLRLLPSR